MLSPFSIQANKTYALSFWWMEKEDHLEPKISRCFTKFLRKFFPVILFLKSENIKQFKITWFFADPLVPEVWIVFLK